MFENLKVWVLSDGKAGHHNQSMCVAEALGVTPEIHYFQRKKGAFFWELVAPHLGVKNPPSGQNGWPDVVIATSYHMASVSKYIKQQNPNTFCVQIMARGRMPWCDAVLSFVHDSPKPAENLLVLNSAPNRITPQNLKTAAKNWAKRLQGYKKPVAFIIGGSCRHLNFTEQKATQMADDVTAWAKQKGASLWVTASRRTGVAQQKIIAEKLEKSGVPHFWWNGEGDNPYLAFLALSDAIIVTPDSFSMVTESCGAGKPVYVYGLNSWGVKKFDVLYRKLESLGYLTAFGGKEIAPPKSPLNERQKIKDFIEKRYLAFKNVG